MFNKNKLLQMLTI